MAPLAATIVATMVATVALGVGVARARAERERRWARELRARERQFALLPGEPVPDGFQRMALGQFDLAIELLADNGEMPAEQAVHDTRKALKRLRAMIRLLRDDLGEQVFAREDAVLREAGMRLAGARDSEVILATLNTVVERHPRALAKRKGVARLRAALAAERDKAIEQMLGDPSARIAVVGDLRAARARVSGWSLSDDGGIAIVDGALKRLYVQGRRRYRRAERGKGNRARAMHEWRKRVKDLRYAAEALDYREPNGSKNGALNGKSAKRSGKHDRRAARLRYVRGVAGRADELSEMLGEDHDLVLLDARVRAERKLAGRRTRRTLLKLIAQRRKRLRRRSLREGRRLYRPRPKKFLARFRAAHAPGSGARAGRS